MTIYILKNARNNQIIQACDLESNAMTLKSNLLKTGEYTNLVIESVEVDTDTILPLHTVKIKGRLSANDVILDIMAINPATTIPDTLSFTVSTATGEVSFSGIVNLTANELAVDDVIQLTSRVKSWVANEYKSRLESGNPVL